MRNWGLTCQDVRAAGETLPLISGFLEVLTEGGQTKIKFREVVEVVDYPLFIGKAVPQGDLNVLSLSVNELHRSW